MLFPKVQTITKDNLPLMVKELSVERDVGFDTETTGLDFKDQAFAVSFATVNNVYYCDLRYVPALGAFLPDLFSEGIFYSHNAKFDLMMLWKVAGRMFPARLHCTKITARLLHNQLTSYSLDSIAGRYGLNKDMRVDQYIKDNQLYENRVFMGEKFDRVPQFQLVPEPLMRDYAGTDAWLHLQIGLKQSEDIRKSL